MKNLNCLTCKQPRKFHQESRPHYYHKNSKLKVSEFKLTQASKSVTLKPYAKIRVRNLPLGVSPILSSVGISRQHLRVWLAICESLSSSDTTLAPSECPIRNSLRLAGTYCWMKARLWLTWPAMSYRSGSLGHFSLVDGGGSSWPTYRATHC